MTNSETFKDVIGYEGKYQVSNLGNVISLLRMGRIVLKPSLRYGYPSVSLCNNGKIKSHTVHSLVANAWISNNINNSVINHIDGDKTNNNILNLEWVTQSENVRHSIKLGLRNTPVGSKHWKTKLSHEDIIAIRFWAKNKLATQKEIGKMFNIHEGSVSQIHRKINWKHI